MVDQSLISLLSQQYAALGQTIQQVLAQIGGSPPSPPPPPPPVDGVQQVDAPDTATLRDANAAAFKFTSPMTDIGSTIWGYYISVNGVDKTGLGVRLVSPIGGVVYVLNCLGEWYAHRGGSWKRETPSPLPSMASPDGASISDVGRYLVDSAGRVFMFFSHLDLTYGASIAINGVQQGNIGSKSLFMSGGAVVSVDGNGVRRRREGDNWVPFDGAVVNPPPLPIPPGTEPPPAHPPGSLGYTLPPALAGEPALTQAEIDAGITDTVFFDHFNDESTIDFAMTNAPDKKLYAGIMALPELGGKGMAGISVDGSWLIMTQDNTPSGGGDNLRTAALVAGLNDKTRYRLPVDRARDLVGFSIPPGKDHSIISRHSCDNAGAEHFPRSWPCHWLLSEEQMLLGLEQWLENNCFVGNGRNQHVEHDYFEIMPGGPSAPYVAGLICSTRRWFTGGPGGSGQQAGSDGTYPDCTWQPQGEGDYGLNNVVVRPQFVPFDPKDGFTMCVVVRLAKNNNGHGLIQHYFNGQHYADVDKHWQTGDGCFLNMLDTQHSVPILGCGNGYGMATDYMGVRIRP